MNCRSHKLYHIRCRTSPGNGGKSAIPATSFFRDSAGGWNYFVGRLMGCLTAAPEGGGGGGVELEDVG